MTVAVQEKHVGRTLLLLNDLGLTPQINIDEEVPLGRRLGPTTAEELLLQNWRPGEQKITRDLTAQLVSLGKAKSSVYTALSGLQKKGKVKKISSGVWEHSA